MNSSCTSTYVVGINCTTVSGRVVTCAYRYFVRKVSGEGKKNPSDSGNEESSPELDEDDFGMDFAR